MLSVGKTDVTGFFTPLDYGIKEGVSVVTGIATNLSLTLSPAPYILTGLWGAGIRNVTRSVGLIDPGKPSLQTPLYIRSFGAGGTVVSSGVPGIWSDADLSANLGGTPVYDLIATANYAYMAASFGALRVPPSAIASGMTAQSLIAASAPFNAGSPNTAILSLATASDGSQGTILYMGTSNGVYSAVLDEQTSLVVNSPSGPLSGTEGKKAKAIRAYEYRDYTSAHYGVFTFVAFLTDTDISIVEIDNASGTSRAVATLTIPSGLPADVPADLNGFSWYNPNFADIYLLIAGKKGLVMYLAGTFNAG
jgi:hypothetical protein